MSIWDNSSFLDLTGAGITTATTPAQAYGITDPVPYGGTINVALVLPRLNDPATLLTGSYAQREAVLNGLTPDQVGALYGSDPADFAAVQQFVASVPGATLLGQAQGYVSTPQSQTVWVQVDAQAFATLFGTALMTGANGGPAYWNGTLSPAAGLGTLAGLWVAGVSQPSASAQDATGVVLADGPQGVANTAGGGYSAANTVVPAQDLYPNQVAAQYEFPLGGDDAVPTPAIGLIEPGVGDAVTSGDPNQLVQEYRAQAGVSGTGTIGEGTTEGAIAPATKGERSLDVGVVATAAPNSDIVAFAGAGNVYTATQEAIWGGGPRIADLSSSFTALLHPAAGSPFQAALDGLDVDAALNNIAVFNDAGDGGSSAELGTGVPEVGTTNTSPFAVVVGGTSTSSQAQVQAAAAAVTDGGPNVNAAVGTLAAQAEAGDVAALETLVAGGLTTAPTATTDVGRFLQTVWNQYDVRTATDTLAPGYTVNETSGGGVDASRPEPAYQADAGIDTQALQQADGIPPDATAGRGVPDVSALAGGNEHYVVPGVDLSGTTDNGGTSAATPLWASLSAQIQAVFADQGLPALGYMNDLLYQASVAFPGSFDDVRFGTNTSSFVYGGTGPDTVSSNGTAITPTGLGDAAAPGYDLASGLGTPDGLLLARALTAIAQAQVHGPEVPAVTDPTGATSTAAQALILQPTLSAGFAGTLAAAGASFTPPGDGSALGFTAQVAQQMMQATFDPALARALAGQAQAPAVQIAVAAGQSLSVSVNGTAATAAAAPDSAPFGFVQYAADGQSVTLARPLAVAATYGGEDDTDAILRIRQDEPGTDELSLYRVDDLLGDIDGVAPGTAGYAVLAGARLYDLADGGTALAADGEGDFAQTDVLGVDNGDLLGFRMTDAATGTTEWGLAAQNPDGADALWAYGADTWGFADPSVATGAAANATSSAAQPHDALLLQLDFTSNAGDALLASEDAPACFVAGTLIATPGGERTVEALTAGEEVLTAGGVTRRVRWTGRRALDLRKHPFPERVCPVRIRAGAFGENLPHRDLRVSPGHALHVDGVLIQAERLLNGVTVLQEDVPTVTYWHVELESHDVLLAEGMPAESYLDTGNRTAFEGGGAFMELHPDFQPKHWAETCAPLMQEGAALEAVKARLLARAADIFGAATTDDPDLHVWADGAVIAPRERTQGHVHFRLPPGCRDVWLLSRSWVPSHLLSASTDTRRLGVCVRHLVLDAETLALDDVRLGEGWHEPERDPAGAQRWTTGAGRLPAGITELDVRTGGFVRYWADHHVGLVPVDKLPSGALLPGMGVLRR